MEEHTGEKFIIGCKAKISTTRNKCADPGTRENFIVVGEFGRIHHDRKVIVGVFIYQVDIIDNHDLKKI
jgi:hypothetical protein